MTALHTATPWRIRDGQEILAGQGEDRLIAQCHAGHKPEREANAAYIVKCVNSHEQLVEALEEAQQYICSCKRRKQSEFNIKNNDYFHILSVMTQALNEGVSND